MTKRERVIAALAGREVDRGSTRLLMHNFASENSARGLAAETLRLARTFDWDYLEPQSRASASRRCGVSRIVRRPNVRQQAYDVHASPTRCPLHQGRITRRRIRHVLKRDCGLGWHKGDHR